MSEDPLEGSEVERRVEALLFAASRPLLQAELQGRLPGADVAAALASLAARYAGRGLELQSVAGGWRFATAPDLAPLLADMAEEPRRLSRAAMETLAVIAYHQPVTRAEIDAIRGVSLSRGARGPRRGGAAASPGGRPAARVGGGAPRVTAPATRPAL